MDTLKEMTGKSLLNRSEDFCAARQMTPVELLRSRAKHFREKSHDMDKAADQLERCNIGRELETILFQSFANGLRE